MKITRSFSKKIQLKQYEPVDSLCGAEMEVGDMNLDTPEEVSKFLDEFCRKEVEKTINQLTPPPKVDKLKALDEGLNDFG